jgi:hypothetical protein
MEERPARPWHFTGAWSPHPARAVEVVHEGLGHVVAGEPIEVVCVLHCHWSSDIHGSRGVIW